MLEKKTAIVTGASGGIGAGLVEGFLKEGYNVVATSRNVSRSLAPSSRLFLADSAAGAFARIALQRRFQPAGLLPQVPARSEGVD
jgi:NAD(P)-dependent dehydrogenase (short-subunit alcohol dehydrogenase family)